MYKLRQTWNDIFSQEKLYEIDTRTKKLDPAWPITAKPPGTIVGVVTPSVPPSKQETVVKNAVGDKKILIQVDEIIQNPVVKSVSNNSIGEVNFLFKNMLTLYSFYLYFVVLSQLNLFS
jgi:hypothetical protein